MVALQILRRFRIRGNTKTAPLSGRPAVTTPRDDRNLASLVKEQPRATAKGLTRKWNEENNGVGKNDGKDKSCLLEEGRFHR